jgi:DNA-binding CsgD family transcriptional regulator
MSCSTEDLEGEATLVAYQVIEILMQEGKPLSLTRGYFSTLFKEKCLQLAKGVPVVSYYDEETMSLFSENRPRTELEEEQAVRKALPVLTRRQRAVAEWILSQKKPATPKMIASHFNVTVRGVRKIINNAVKRLDNSGYQNICKSVTLTS